MKKTEILQEKLYPNTTSFVKESASGLLYQVVLGFESQLRLESSRDLVFVIRYVNGNQNLVVPASDFEGREARFSKATDLDFVEQFCGLKGRELFGDWQAGFTIQFFCAGSFVELPPFNSPRFEEEHQHDYFSDKFLCKEHSQFSAIYDSEFRLTSC